MAVNYDLANLAPGAASGLTFRNRIINGDMRIDQRNAGASVTPAAGTSTFIVDRFSAYGTQASKFSAQQNAGSVTPPVGFSNYLGATSLSAYSSISTDLFRLFHSIEGYNISDFAWGTVSAKTVTLSFWVRSSQTGTFGGSLQNSSNNRAYAFTYTIIASNTWEFKTITIPGETSGTWNSTNGVGIAINFDLGAGSTKQIAPGSWQAVDANAATGCVSTVGTNGATLYITGVQFEQGITATPFERRPINLELMLCQRYYETTRYPAATFTQSSTIIYIAGTANYAPGRYFTVVKRATPTVVIYSRNNTSASASAVATGSNITGTVSAEGISTTGFWSTSSGSGTYTAGTAYEAGYTADAEL